MTSPPSPANHGSKALHIFRTKTLVEEARDSGDLVTKWRGWFRLCGCPSSSMSSSSWEGATPLGSLVDGGALDLGQTSRSVEPPLLTHDSSLAQKF
eukprot:scaffold12928_cov64-Cyclotella_meneghiniana.AAC.7